MSVFRLFVVLYCLYNCTFLYVVSIIWYIQYIYICTHYFYNCKRRSLMHLCIFSKKKQQANSRRVPSQPGQWNEMQQLLWLSRIVVCQCGWLKITTSMEWRNSCCNYGRDYYNRRLFVLNLIGLCRMDFYIKHHSNSLRRYSSNYFKV